MKDYLDYYRVYRLAKVSDPYRPYVKGENNGWWIRKINGECVLELLAEMESVEEILVQFPMIEAYYEVGYKNVKPFIFAKNLRFNGLSVYSGKRSVGYHVNGTAEIDGNLAFQLIYESFGNDILFVVPSWNAEKLADMRLFFRSGKEYHLTYNLQFEGKWK